MGRYRAGRSCGSGPRKLVQQKSLSVLDRDPVLLSTPPVWLHSTDSNNRLQKRSHVARTNRCSFGVAINRLVAPAVDTAIHLCGEVPAPLHQMHESIMRPPYTHLSFTKSCHEQQLCISWPFGPNALLPPPTTPVPFSCFHAWDEGITNPQKHMQTSVQRFEKVPGAYWGGLISPCVPSCLPADDNRAILDNLNYN